MSFQSDVHNMFLQFLENCHGNKAEAARKLGVSPVTFWLWVSGERQPIKEAISRAIDSAGARLAWTGQSVEEQPSNPVVTDEQSNGRYLARITELEQRLSESEESRLSLAGEVKALEKQLARLMPAPSSVLQSNGGIEVVSPKKLNEKEPQSSDSKTASG